MAIVPQDESLMSMVLGTGRLCHSQLMTFPKFLMSAYLPIKWSKIDQVRGGTQVLSVCQSDTVLRRTLSLGPAGKMEDVHQGPSVDSYASCLPSQKATQAESRGSSCVISMSALNPGSHLVLCKQAQRLLSADSAGLTLGCGPHASQVFNHCSAFPGTSRWWSGPSPLWDIRDHWASTQGCPWWFVQRPDIGWEDCSRLPLLSFRGVYSCKHSGTILQSHRVFILTLSRSTWGN